MASRNQVPVVTGVIVRPALIRQSLAVSGSLAPYEETVLTAGIAGRVVSINLPEGKSVRQGDLLVKIFDDDLQAGLSQLQAQAEIAKQNEKRQSELVRINGISQAEYEQAVLQTASVNAEIESMKVRIRKTEVRAPYDGVIGLRSVSPGAEVTSATPLATIRAVAQLKLDFSVPEKYSGRIKVGQKVFFTVDGDDAKHQAVVSATEGGIDAATRTMKIRSVVKKPAVSLKPGAFAHVELVVGENERALMVPTQAIIPREQDKRVIVARAGKAQFVIVKTGVRQSGTIEVTDGLSPGDTVVTTGLLFIKSGMPLKFSSVAQ